MNFKLLAATQNMRICANCAENRLPFHCPLGPVAPHDEKNRKHHFLLLPTMARRDPAADPAAKAWAAAAMTKGDLERTKNDHRWRWIG